MKVYKKRKEVILMAKKINDGSSLPTSDADIQKSAVQTVTNVASGDVKKALTSSVNARVSQSRNDYSPPTTTENEVASNSAQYNFYYNQQVINNNQKSTSIANYVNGSNNELKELTSKIKKYENRGTQLTKEEINDLKKTMTAIKSNKYVYSHQDVLEFAKTVKSFNKSGVSNEKLSGSLKTLRELKSGFKSRTAMDKASKFKSAPATVGNVLKSGIDDAKHELEYKGKGEKEAMLLAGSLTIVAAGSAWKEKGRNLVAKNFDKDSATEDSFNTGIKKRLSENKRYKAKHIDNGYLLTGFKVLRNSADSVIIKTFADSEKPITSKKLKVDFSKRKSINKYVKTLEKTAVKLGLEENLSGATTAYLQKLRNEEGITNDQKIIIDAMLEMRNLDNLKDSAIVEHMKELGINTGLEKINYNNKSDIKHALNCYSTYFTRIGVTDYTKMSVRKLNKMLKNDNLDPKTKTMIQDILALKKQQQYQANKKMATKTSALKAYALASRLMGSSDVMQGAQIAMQVVTGVKTALVTANVARKVFGHSSKFIGRNAYKGVAHFAKKTTKGAKVIKKIDRTTSKYRQLKADTKYVKNEVKIAIKDCKKTAKKEVANKLANSKIGKRFTRIKQNKVFNNKITKKVRKVSKAVREKMTKAFSKLLSAFNFINKLKLYVLIGIGGLALAFYLLYAILLPLSNNSEIAAPVEMQVQTDTDGNAQKDANGNYIITQTDNIKDTVFYKIYDMLVTTDNNWFAELEGLKTKNPKDVVFDATNGDAKAIAYFPEKVVTGFWNPSKNKLFEVSKFGTTDTDASGNKINEGVYYSFEDNNGGTISKHSNIKMCISLAHGFINGDHENYPDEFKEFAMGLWNNSHSSHPVLMEQNLDPYNKYIYSCISGDETFTYKCTTNTSVKPSYTSSQEAKDQATTNNATIKVITSDTKNPDYANAVKQTLIVTENGCTSKTHKNNGNTGYVLYDNILHKETKNTTSDGSARDYSKLYTSSTPEFIVYNKDFLSEPTSTITLSSTQTLHYSSACDNYSIVEDGTYITKFCNQSYLGDKATGQHPSIKGCIATAEPTFCGTKKTTLNGNQAYVNSLPCTNSSSHSFKHKKITVTETVTETKIVSIFPFITQQVTKEVQKQVLDPACDASFFGECLTHYWYECHGHVDAYCNGHQIPNYKIQCNGHNDCSGHTANICSGHVDLDVASTIVGLDENDNLYTKNMWEASEIDDGIFNLYSPNYRSFKDLCDAVFGQPGQLNSKFYNNNPLIKIKTASGSVVDGYTWDPTLNGGTLHWSDDMKGYTNALYNTDWFELYGFDEIYATHKIDTTLIRLSEGEIEDYIEEFYPCNSELYYAKNPDGSDSAYKIAYDKRVLILTRALTAVERIPYYPGGTSDELQVPLEANNFGEVIRDANGKPIKKYTSNGKVALYLKGLDSESFVRWASTTVTDKVNTTINKSTPISINDATPGDIVHYTGSDKYAIYLGKETTVISGATNTVCYLIEMVDFADKAGNVKISRVNSNPSLIAYKTIS